MSQQKWNWENNIFQSIYFPVCFSYYSKWIKLNKQKRFIELIEQFFQNTFPLNCKILIKLGFTWKLFYKLNKKEIIYVFIYY